ncbi:aromatic amino acid aminotransferase [Pyricularia oryzae 70-15]|uniref:Aromatic amino acid aminotransferase n=1 Tax=Pyricularia oryzae (strain 70-15 / ATCC MYA-4617 / FGSC 8958) TaxID=242507 RepID=G4MZ85_PYRO7|nr:aromatic amino acid aminotransferase [Pyricularia oryzae 70-15]EHA55358.1 aromatic amino acid aminotransferase [Pyricularia oryzae 70-15]
MQLPTRPLSRRQDNGEDDSRPLPRDLSHYYSQTTKNRKPSQVKEFYKFFQIPGIVNFAGGLPNLRFFPFDTLEAQTAKPERWTPSESTATNTDSRSNGDSRDRSESTHITVPLVAKETDPLRKIDLATALQYGMADGYPPLLSFVRQFTREHLHPDVPYRSGPEVVLTVGSTDGFAKTLELFVDPWSEGKGDDVRDRPGLLCERFAYGNVLTQARPKGVQVVTVEADSGGMLADGPGGLEDVLANWDDSKGRRPHLLYTVTMGHNPTGIVLDVERRKALYAICSKYDVLIVEDDPYWYMQFPSAAREEAKSRNLPPPQVTSTYSRSTGYPFLDSLVPSFLSFDVDGRVVRLDTFSKTVAPGCRLGWLTAQPAIIERFVRITETSTQQPSGFVQSMIGELVMSSQPTETKTTFLGLRTHKDRTAFTGWQMDGWVRWLEGLRGVYEDRMNRVCRILDDGKYQLKQGTPVVPGSHPLDADWGVITKKKLFEFDWPRGGMFVWLRVFFESHPLWKAPRPGKDGEPAGVMDGGVLSGALLAMLTKKPWLVLVAPGFMFSANEEIQRKDGWAYFRLCFAAEAEEAVDPCTQRFVDGIQRFWKIKTVREIEDLLKGFPISSGEASSMNVADQDVGNMGMYMGC